MSDAAPLPRLGEVFFDVRGNSRSMRLSWYADTGVAVFSIWQAGMCTGTFRLPIADLSRMIDILQRGPSPEGRGHAPVSEARRGPERGRGDYPADDEISMLDSTSGPGRYAAADYGRSGQGPDYPPADYGSTGGHGSAGDYGSAGYGADYQHAGYEQAGSVDPGHDTAGFGHDTAGFGRDTAGFGRDTVGFGQEGAGAGQDRANYGYGGPGQHRDDHHADRSGGLYRSDNYPADGGVGGSERHRNADYGAGAYQPADYGAGPSGGREPADYGAGPSGGREPADYGAGPSGGREPADYDYQQGGYRRDGHAEDDAVRRGSRAGADNPPVGYRGGVPDYRTGEHPATGYRDGTRGDISPDYTSGGRGSQPAFPARGHRRDDGRFQSDTSGQPPVETDQTGYLDERFVPPYVQGGGESYRNDTRAGDTDYPGDLDDAGYPDERRSVSPSDGYRESLRPGEAYSNGAEYRRR